MQVDWRNRFGWPWISSIRNQGGTNNCWAFAMTALYEAMVRIEHAVWCRRSEGETVRTTGKDYRSLGNLGEATIAAQRYGVADPDCFPWTTWVALYLSRPHAGDMQDLPIAPTPDRPGRTVRIAEGSFTTLTTTDQKKQWIDAVGPAAAMFVPPTDFNGYSGGIYTPTVPPAPNIAHAVLVVGFDDVNQCWIVKNSWGPIWGEAGFARIAYGANIIEQAALVGVRNTNPDPWTRRRLRTGGLLQSGNGAQHDNIELFLRCGSKLEQWWRGPAVTAAWQRVGEITNSDPYSSWHGGDALDAPAVIQSTFNRNFELIYRSSAGRLQHVHYDQAFQWWIDDDRFGPSGVIGVPGFAQGTRGAPGDFEVVVATQGGTLQNWTKHNSAPWTQQPGTWYLRQDFGSGVAFAGPGLVQSRLGAVGSVLEDGRGELHYVCGAVGGVMAHYRRPAGGPWGLVGTFGANISSAPCLIEGQFGAATELDVGNFELCVAVNGQIEHWWRDNHTQGPWTRSVVFGADVRRVIGLIESSGFNLELVAERSDGRYQHFYRDGTGWHAGAIITCKDTKDTKDRKDNKDAKEDDKLAPKETDKLAPKETDLTAPLSEAVAEEGPEGVERPFVTDRPEVGEQVVAEPAWGERGTG
jgi:hypothetical protein